MPAEEREPDAVVAPQRYVYFQLLQCLREQGLTPRMLNELTLAFPVADIASCDGAHVRLAFMGLLGAAGALPYHYTERIAGSPDPGPRAFVDMLSARVLEQFDAAWHKHRLSQERLLELLMALGGTQDSALAQYAALTRRRTVSANAVGRALSEYFGVVVQVEQFVERWEAFARQDRLALGALNCTLGGNAALGERQWRCDLHIRLHIGPLDIAAFQGFLPGGPGAAALRRMIAGLTRSGARGGAGDEGEEMAEVCVGLEAGCVRGAVLGGDARVGYNAFLITSEEHEPRSELRYRL
jgi:type VI secretion system protein ImpH